MVRIMIADTDVEDAKNLASVIESMGHKVVAVTDSAGQAVSDMARLDPDLLFWDAALAKTAEHKALAAVLEKSADAALVLMDKGVNGDDSPLKVNGAPCAFLKRPADERSLSQAITTAISIREREIRLKKSLRLNTLLLDSLPHPALLVDHGRTIVKANKAARRMGALEGTPCYKAFSKSRRIECIIKPSAGAAEPGRCAFCRLDEVVAADRPFESLSVALGDKAFDFYWIPVEGENLVLHYAVEVTGRVRMEEELSWELAVNNALCRLSEPLIGASLELSEVANMVLSEAMSLTGSRTGYVLESDSSTTAAVVRTLPEGAGADFKARNGVFRVFRDGEHGSVNPGPAALVNLLSKGADDALKADSEGELPFTRLLTVPVKMGDETIGQICLADRPEKYRASDFKAVHRLASMYSLAVQRRRFEEILGKNREELEQRVHERTAELTEANRRLTQEVDERKRMEGVLMQIAHTVSSSVSDEIFQVLASNIADILQVEFAMIGEIAEEGAESIRTIAAVSGGEVIKNFDYPISGTPCAYVAGRNLCLYPQDAASLFPEDTVLSEMKIEGYGGIPLFDSSGRLFGTLTVMDTKPFSDTNFVVSMLRVFGIRASAEMERRRSEERIRRNRAMLQTIFDGIPEPLLMFSRDLVVHMLNRPAAAYYQASHVGAVGRPCHLAFRGRETPCEGCSIASALAEGTSYRFERKCPHDPDRLEKVIIYPINGDPDEPGRFIVRISDVTEEKLIQRQLIQTEKLTTLGLLVSGIAHEINNPNSFITFNIPIMQEYVSALMPIADAHFANNSDADLFGMNYEEFRDDLFHLLENIKHGSDRINGIVKKLKSFVKMDSVEEKIWFEPQAVIEKGINMVRNQVSKKVKVISLNVQDNIPLVHSNPMVVEQILINLLLNASHAADKPESWVKISAMVRKSGQDILFIQVKDNGCGMEPEVRKKLFRPFFTSHSAGDGTGLGLYITKNLIEGLGGKIEVESTPGLGSTFQVSMPVLIRAKSVEPVNGMQVRDEV